MPKATIEDVATLAGVSIKTVSRVVNREPNVRDSTRTIVNEAIARLKYKPNLSARRLAARRSYIVGLLYDDPSAYDGHSANYLLNVQSGVLALCNARGYDLLIHPCDHRNPQIAEEIAGLKEQGRCDGVILTPPVSDIRGLARALKRARVPFVRIAPSNRDTAYPWVATTDATAGYEITRHLIALGHRRIGFIKGHPDHKAMQTREDGFRRALGAAKLRVPGELLVQGFNSLESGQKAGKRLLAMKRPPTAIFAANDDMAAGVMRAAAELEIRVPAQLSVAGFDDTPIASQTWPTLTTIRQPIREMAEAAASILLEELEPGDGVPPGKIIDAQLVIRESTGPAPMPPDRRR